MTKYLMEQGKINNFRNQKAGNKFEANFRKKGTQAIFFREQGPPSPPPPGGT